MKLALLAAVAVLAAAPAFADCRTDAQAQADKVTAATQALNAKASAPMAEQCQVSVGLIAESKRLNQIYKTCRTDLKLTDAQLQDFDQKLAAADQEYSTRCGG